jgi:hypothetical protein
MVVVVVVGLAKSSKFNVHCQEFILRICTLNLLSLQNLLALIASNCSRAFAHFESTSFVLKVMFMVDESDFGRVCAIVDSNVMAPGTYLLLFYIVICLY